MTEQNWKVENWQHKLHQIVAVKLRGSRTYGPFHLLLLDWPVKLCCNKIPTKWIFSSKICMCSHCCMCQWGCALLLFSVSVWCLCVQCLGIWRIYRPASACCHIHCELSLQCCHLRYTSQLCVSQHCVLSKTFSPAPLLPCSIFWGDTAVVVQYKDPHCHIWCQLHLIETTSTVRPCAITETGS